MTNEEMWRIIGSFSSEQTRAITQLLLMIAKENERKEKEKKKAKAG